MQEKELILACLTGNRKAQKRLFELHYPTVFRLAKRYMCRREDTEDVVISAFNKAFSKLENFEYRGEGSFQKWLNTIAVNDCLKTLRKIKHIRFEEEIELQTPDFIEESVIDVEQIMSILEKMPTGYRTVFNLYAMEEFTHSEIAEALSISRNTSKSQLLKARKFIVAELNKKREYGT